MQLLTLDAARTKMGRDLGVSDWKLIDQPLVDAFAKVTGDRQFIHVDPEAAANTPFGGTVAHGFLTLSLLATLLPPNLILFEGVVMGVNYGFEKVRFLTPCAQASASVPATCWRTSRPRVRTACLPPPP